MRTATIMTIVALAAAFALSGCGSENGDTITIVFAAGNDPSGATASLIERYNATHPGVEVRFQIMPANTDTQHDAYVTYLSAHESSIDLYSLDVIWTAEFARAGWVEPLPEAIVHPEEFLSGPIASVTYEGKIYAVPWFTDAGVLYYREDLLEDAGLSVPQTWDAFVAACEAVVTSSDMDGFVWQGARYEGLVCNFLEYLWGVGGSLDPDHLLAEPELAASEITETLNLMSGLIANDAVTPRSVLTYKEEDARRLFTEGRSLFLRNWPYAWGMAEEEGSKVIGKTGIAPLPHAKNRTSYSTIGGWNIALSSFSEHRQEALEFLSFITSEEALRLRAIEGSYMPTRLVTYEDPAVLEANPHFADFFEVFKNTRNRPRSPHYPRISDVIQENVHRALSGEITSKAAAEKIVTELADILSQ